MKKSLGAGVHLPHPNWNRVKVLKAFVKLFFIYEHSSVFSLYFAFLVLSCKLQGQQHAFEIGQGVKGGGGGGGDRELKIMLPTMVEQLRKF